MRGRRACSSKERFITSYNAYKDEMYQCAYEIVRNDADAQKAVQDALLCILKNIGRLSEDAEKVHDYVLAEVRRTAAELCFGNKKSRMEQRSEEEGNAWMVMTLMKLFHK